MAKTTFGKLAAKFPIPFWKRGQFGETAVALAEDAKLTVRSQNERRWKGDRFSHLRPLKSVCGPLRRRRPERVGGAYKFDKRITVGETLRDRAGNEYCVSLSGQIYGSKRFAKRRHIVVRRKEAVYE